MDGWNYLYLADPGPLDVKLQRLPEIGAAVYAFYVDVRVSDGLVGRDLVDRLQELCALPHGPSRKTRLWPYETLMIEYQSDLPFSFIAWDAKTEELFETPTFSEEIRAVMDAIQQVLPPLYVGETHQLRARIANHLSPSSDLSLRLADRGLDVAQLLLRYMILDGVAPVVRQTEEFGDAVEDQYAVYLPVPVGTPNEESSRRAQRFIEELVTRLCKPRFTSKLGGHQQ